jgi:hypothetical protein
MLEFQNIPSAFGLKNANIKINTFELCNFSIDLTAELSIA